MHKFFSLFCLLAIFIQCQQHTISGRVVKVADGDTFTLLTNDNQQLRIRLHGIDAPEKSQDFSKASKDYLTDLVMQKPVKVYSKKRDQYGRIVAIVMVDDLVINEAMLRAGLAWHFTEYDDNSAWREMELIAQRNKVGIWSHPNPLPPWEFRKTKRSQRQR